MSGKKDGYRNSGIWETVLWCEICWNRDKTVRLVTNNGGECCILKKTRSYGKECEWWIRDKVR
jgi:hypothetical protein